MGIWGDNTVAFGRAWPRLPLLLFIAIWIGGCEQQQPSGGKALYNYHCAGCHAEEGTGKFLKGVPPVAYSEKSVSEMVAWMRGHRPNVENSRMPVFSDLTPEQLREIAVYLRQQLHQRL